MNTMKGEAEIRRIGEAEWFTSPALPGPINCGSQVGISTAGRRVRDRRRLRHGPPRTGSFAAATGLEFEGWVLRVRRMEGRRVAEVELLKR